MYYNTDTVREGEEVACVCVRGEGIVVSDECEGVGGEEGACVCVGRWNGGE